MIMTKEGEFNWNMVCLSLVTAIGAALIVAGFVLWSGGAEAETITVDDDGGADYETIQDAIDAAKHGDTVRVYNGTYEERLVVDKRISLIGNGSENTTIETYLGGYVVTKKQVQDLIARYKDILD